MKKAFKLVRITGNVTHSATFEYNTLGCVVYVIEKPSAMPLGCGPLTAFETLDQLISFFREYSTGLLDREYGVLEVDCKLFFSLYPFQGNKALWIHHNKAMSCNFLPAGTLLCQQITPLKDITPPSSQPAPIPPNSPPFTTV